MSWTRYCLSSASLRALDRVYQSGGAYVGGPTRGALIRRELVRPKTGKTMADYNTVEITASGVFALDQARKEGWQP